MLAILRKWAHKGTHRRKVGQSPSIYTKPRIADESWYIA